MRLIRCSCIRCMRSQLLLDCSWNMMAHDDARVGRWRGNWRMEWVASTLHTTSEHVVSSITTADAHTSAASSRLNWRPPADLNGLVRSAERQNLVSAHVPSHFKRSLQYNCIILSLVLKIYIILPRLLSFQTETRSNACINLVVWLQAFAAR